MFLVKSLRGELIAFVHQALRSVRVIRSPDNHHRKLIAVACYRTENRGATNRKMLRDCC